MATRRYKIGDILLSGTAGKDLLINGEYWANEVGGIGLRITGGYGNDTITNSGAKAMLYGDDGDDSIYNGYHYYEPWNIFYDAVAPSEKKGNIGENATVYGGAGNDTIFNRGNNVTLDSGYGNDTIKNLGTKSVLNGGSGNDIIVNGQYFERGGLDVSIKGGAGNDTITNAGANAVLDGGVGNDVIYNGYYYHDGTYYDNNSNNDQKNNKYNGSNTTIRGGAGNDTIYGGAGAEIFQYALGDGDDIIWGYTSGQDKIQLSKGKVNAYTIIENDVVLSIGKGQITIKDAKDKAITFCDGAGKQTKATYHLQESEKMRCTEVAHGTAKSDKLVVLKDRTQVYGLAGNDMIESNGKRCVLLIGGSGDDTINMAGGNGTLVGGKGKDTFNFTYSAKNHVSAVIEDIDWKNDKIIVNFTGSGTPNIHYNISGNNVIWYDDKGYFKLVLKGSSGARDYFDKEVNECIWDILRLVNRERDKVGLAPLILSDDLSRAADIRSREIVQYFSHDRPNGSSCFTAVKESYQGKGENLAEGYASADDAMTGWMNSKGHRENILCSYFSHIGVGYTYNLSSDYKHHWAQMFGGALSKLDVQSATTILKTKLTLNSGTDYVRLVGGPADDVLTAVKAGSSLNGGVGNDTLIGGTGKDVFWYGTGDGNDTVKNYTPGKDSIRIFKGSLTSGSVSGGDVVLKIGSGSLKLIGMAGKKISVAGTDGKTLQHVFGTKDKNTTWSYTKGYGYHGANKTDTLKVAGKNAVAINLGNTVMYSNIDKIDAGNAAGKMTLTGGANYVTLKGGTAADVLKAGKAGATLEGGKGNDMLYGGAGKDKFIFRKGYGKDTVMSSGKGDIAYLYNITNIKQAKFSLSKGVLSMKFTNSSDTLTVKGWSASGMNTVVLGNGGKYQLGISSGKVTTKKI